AEQGLLGLEFVQVEPAHVDTAVIAQAIAAEAQPASARDGPVHDAQPSQLAEVRLGNSEAEPGQLQLQVTRGRAGDDRSFGIELAALADRETCLHRPFRPEVLADVA